MAKPKDKTCAEPREFVTRLVQAGRSLPEIAALAGHRNIATTMRYVHVAPQYLREGIRALESSLSTGQAMKSTTS